MSRKTLVSASLAAMVGSDFAPLGLDTGGHNQPGLICAANEARFTASHYSEPLTAYTVGWVDPEAVDQLLEDLFPSVEVGRRFEFKKADNAEEFYSEVDDIRAIGSPFKKVEYKGTTVNEKTHNKGLTVTVDKDDVVGDNFREVTVGRLMRRLLRNDLRRALALLDAASTNVGVIFSTATNPDGFIRAALKLGTDASGIRPNTVAIGEAANDLRMDAYEGADTPYAGRAAAMTPVELASKLMVDLVKIVKARYQSTATAKAVAVASVIYAYLAIKGAGKDDPSNVKRFVTPCTGGRFGVYINERDKFVDVSVEHYSNTVITSTLGIRKLTVTNS